MPDSYFLWSWFTCQCYANPWEQSHVFLMWWTCYDCCQVHDGNLYYLSACCSRKDVFLELWQNDASLQSLIHFSVKKIFFKWPHCDQIQSLVYPSDARYWNIGPQHCRPIFVSSCCTYLQVLEDIGISPVLDEISIFFWRHSFDVCSIVQDIDEFLVCLSACLLAYTLKEIMLTLFSKFWMKIFGDFHT